MDPKAGSKFSGFPNQSESEADAPLDLTRRLIVHPAATFLMREGGHLLAGIGILRGDFLVVDRSLDPRDGDVVVVIVDGEIVSVIWRRIGGQIALEVGSPGMSPYIWGEGCVVFGVVTATVRELRQAV